MTNWPSSKWGVRWVPCCVAKFCFRQNQTFQGLRLSVALHCVVWICEPIAHLPKVNSLGNYWRIEVDVKVKFIWTVVLLLCYMRPRQASIPMRVLLLLCEGNPLAYCGWCEPRAQVPHDCSSENILHVNGLLPLAFHVYVLQLLPISNEFVPYVCYSVATNVDKM
jgi:hypothetical protein